MKLLPKAHTADIVIQNLKDEVLIYNVKTNEAFCLNETSANVFNNCDGVTTFDDLKSKYKLTDEIIYLALDKLKEQSLLESDYHSPFAGMTRREVIRKVGLASIIALPVVSAIVAPTAMMAASSCTTPVGFAGAQGNCPNNQRCVNSSCIACTPSGQPIPGGVCSPTNASGIRQCCNMNCLIGDPTCA